MSDRDVKTNPPTPDGSLRMQRASARMTVLEAVGLSEGRWERDRYDRAFPPGWFADEPPNTEAFDILYRLQKEGLVTGPDRSDQARRFALTDLGREALREAGLEPPDPSEGP
jgi:hypothetical protein